MFNPPSLTRCHWLIFSVGELLMFNSLGIFLVRLPRKDSFGLLFGRYKPGYVMKILLEITVP